MGSVIRAYKKDDLDAVVRLSLDAWAPVFVSIRESFGEELYARFYGGDWRSYQQQSVESVLTDEKSNVFVAESDGEVVGFVAIVVHDDRIIGEISMIAVAPEHQRKGHAAALTTFATDWIREQGIPVAMVETGGDPGHAPARATYEDAGFTLSPVARYFKAL
jgi:ribosomal protein S18 acetylase RimI-like enzyme